MVTDKGLHHPKPPPPPITVWPTGPEFWRSVCQLQARPANHRWLTNWRSHSTATRRSGFLLCQWQVHCQTQVRNLPVSGPAPIPGPACQTQVRNLPITARLVNQGSEVCQSQAQLAKHRSEICRSHAQNWPITGPSSDLCFWQWICEKNPGPPCGKGRAPPIGRPDL